MDKPSSDILSALKGAGTAGLPRRSLRDIAGSALKLNKLLKSLGTEVTELKPDKGETRYYAGNVKSYQLEPTIELTKEEKLRVTWMDKARALGAMPEPTAPTDALRELVKVTRASNARAAVDERRANKGAAFIGKAIELAKTSTPPVWKRKKKASTNKHPTYAVAMLSDVHGDETVFPEQVDFMNGVDRGISFARLQNFFNNTLEIADRWLGDNIEYDGITVTLGGDMVTGYIHDELRETNAAPIFDTVFDYGRRIVAGLILLSEYFPVVRVPCVVGNHGRLDKKPRHKNAVHDSYDWAMYQFMQEMVKAHGLQDRIQFIISDSPDQRFTIYDTSFLLTHGDQFRGGNGISGIYTALMKGDHDKRRRESRVGRAYDWLLLAHFHQLIFGTRFIVNGALIGYNEYAAAKNYDFEEPQQAFFLVDQNHGLTGRWPIHVKSDTEPWEVGLVERNFGRVAK